MNIKEQNLIVIFILKSFKLKKQFNKLNELLFYLMFSIPFKPNNKTGNNNKNH